MASIIQDPANDDMTFETIIGTADNDTLEGTARTDFMQGLDGDDALYGADGDDFIQGGAGDDILRGGAGRDVLHVGAGDNTLDGEGDADTYLFTAEATGDNVILRPLESHDRIDRMVGVVGKPNHVGHHVAHQIDLRPARTPVLHRTEEPVEQVEQTSHVGEASLGATRAATRRCAERLGLWVLKSNPYATSTTCARCRHVDRESRKSQAVFRQGHFTLEGR